MSKLLTEQRWRELEEFRRDWSAFCDCDAVSPDFPERMEAAGYIELGDAADLPEDPFVWEKYGDDPPKTVWMLTDLGRSALGDGEQAPANGDTGHDARRPLDRQAHASAAVTHDHGQSAVETMIPPRRFNWWYVVLLGISISIIGIGTWAKNGWGWGW